jgi:plastocyanin
MAFKKLGIAALALVGTGLVVVPRSFASAPAAAEVVHPAAAAAVLIVNSGGTCKSEFCFSPSAITVRQAQTVTWTNKSVTDHTVTRCTTAACPGAGPGTGGDPAFGSPVLAPAKTFSVTFHKTGTYNYYCQIHGFAVMHGTVTVLGFAVLTPSLPNGTEGKGYSTALSAGGGKAPLHWSLTAGHLPSGLVLNTASGAISGTPKVAGKSIFTVKVTDSSSPALSAARQLSITIS